MFVYIAVMGTMASGKTTMARLIADDLHFHLLEENFGDNAFLPRFYDDMRRWAFHSQTFYLMEKISQMIDTVHLLQKHCVIQDVPIMQDVFSYAKAQHKLGNMDNAEWRLYKKIYHGMEPYLPTPDLIIYLKTKIETIQKRIQSRGRGYEQEIPVEYLRLLDSLNASWVRSTDIPVMEIDTDSYNIVRSKHAREHVTAMIVSALRAKNLRLP